MSEARPARPRDRRTAEGRHAAASTERRRATGARARTSAVRAKPSPAAAPPTRRQAATESAGTRQRLLLAAAAEFAHHGFAGASVDRIATAAGLTKAMIYYHFASKQALYREIVGGMFEAVGTGIRALADSAATPEAQVARFVETIATEAEARPHFPAIWFREIAEGGIHLDSRTVREIAAIVKTLVGILEAGVRAGRFKVVDPMIVHAAIVGPIMLFFASGRLRQRLARAGAGGAGEMTRDALVAHVQKVTLAALAL